MINVFLVDDHELVRTGIRRIIEDVRGMNVAGEADSGEDAVKWCRSNHADVVLMDMNMPVMGGMEATEHLRECGFKLPILALTAMVLDEEIQKCIDSGCNGFLPKPIRQQSLVSVLADYFEFADELVSDKAVSDKTVPVTCNTSTETMTVDPVAGATMVVEGKMNDQVQIGSEAGKRPAYHLPSVVKSSLPDDPDFNSIVADFADRLPDALDVFVTALENQDMVLLRERSHWLVGSAGTVGFEAFVEPARELEHLDDDFPRAIELVKHIFELGHRIEVREASCI